MDKLALMLRHLALDLREHYICATSLSRSSGEVLIISVRLVLQAQWSDVKLVMWQGHAESALFLQQLWTHA